MTFHFQPNRKIRRFPICSALLLGIGAGLSGCASVSPPGPGADNPGQNLPSYVRNLPKSKSGNMAQYTVFGKRYRTLDSAANFSEQGIASWYGKKFHGRKTSSGEPYDMYAMTAAHKHLPLPTYVRVTNLDNNKSVIVLVNDRGPFVGDRVIDLSFAAAMEIEMAEKGTTEVHIEALSTHFIDAEVGASNANIAQADTSEGLQGESAPSVIEPELAAVPLQTPLNKEATDILSEQSLSAQSELDAGPLLDLQSDALAQPTAPAAALPAQTAQASNDQLLDGQPLVEQPSVEVDTTEDGFVELSTLDSVPAVSQPKAVTSMVDDATPRIVADGVEAGGNAFIQLGAFSQRDNAQKMVDRVTAEVGLPAFVERDNSGSLFRVKMGPFKNGPLLEKTLVELESVGIESYTLLASTR